MWRECKSACALGTSTPVIFLFMTIKAQSGTGLERDLIQKVAEIKYRVSSHSEILRFEQYGPIECLNYSWMGSGCSAGGAL